MTDPKVNISNNNIINNISNVPAEKQRLVDKILGPVCSEFGEDIKRLYKSGRDKLFAAAARKIEDVEDGRTSNPRVTRDVILNGPFSEDEVCAEYFGGILASSRTDDGKDDSSIQFVGVIKSLSAKQLKLHYFIYYALNKLLIRQKRQVNVAQSNEIQRVEIWMQSMELKNQGIDLYTDLNALWRKGLLNEYKHDVEMFDNKPFYYTMVKPTSFGIMLYAAAHNKMDRWLLFPVLDLGSFDAVKPPSCVFASDLTSLKNMVEMPAA